MLAPHTAGWAERLGLTVADYIPFANTNRDCQILDKHFPNAEVIRTSGEALNKVSKHLATRKIWADAGVDGLEQWPKMSDNFKAYISFWSDPERIVDTDFQKKPDRTKVSEFALSVLDHLCTAGDPEWVSVPQMPCVLGSGRNKLNRQLADAASTWQQRHRFKGRLVLPFIVTHVSQIKLKQERNKKVDLLCDCLKESGANALWVVDRSLNDQDGASSVKDFRLKAVIELHEQIRERIPESLAVIAGPYWGLNLILWSKGIVQHPAIGLGNAFQYHLPGGHLQTPKSRIAISPLKRLAVASVSLKGWLEDTLNTISRSDTAFAEIASLLKAFPHLQVDGRNQVAATYAQWLTRLQHLPPSGRALALYQDFSSAYVFGRALKPMPQEEGSARRPERIAEQLMLYCL